MTEERSKAETKNGQRLLFAVIVLLAGVVIVLLAGVIFMQVEITNLRGTFAEWKPSAGYIDGNDNKTRYSSPLIEHAPTSGEVTEGKHTRLSRALRQRVHRYQSEKNKIPLCKRMPYDTVMFPNRLNHRTQEEAMKFLKKFETLVNSNCSPFLGYFLCSFLAPPFKASRRSIPPCKELCSKATKPCRNLLKKFRLRLPSAMQCSRLPKQGTSKCYDGPKASKCYRMTVDLYGRHPCSAYVPSSSLQFPNYFGHMDTTTASNGIKKFTAILEIALEDCGFLLSRFLCSLYAPTCRKTTFPVPPCRKFCQQARTRCQRVIDHLHFQWPEDHNCQQFPKKGEAPCYGGPLTGVIHRPQPVAGKCQALSIPFCKNVPYNMTTFPNFFLHKTQKEAALEVHQFWWMIDRKCSRDVELFLCSLYAPICTILDTPPLPCRELCLRVQRGCSVVLRALFSTEWRHTSLACENFPSGGGEEVCVDRPRETSQVTISQSSQRKGRCEMLSISMCKGVNYNMTMVPNSFNHRTQQQAASELHPSLYFGMNLSHEMTLFVCSLYAPPCGVPYKPCRELCTRAQRSCIHSMELYGYPWPEDMACDKFPAAGQGSECIEPQPTTPPPTRPSRSREDW